MPQMGIKIFYKKGRFLEAQVEFCVHLSIVSSRMVDRRESCEHYSEVATFALEAGLSMVLLPLHAILPPSSEGQISQ